MRKNSYIFTAILAIVVSTGAWADAPATDDERAAGTVHEVYKPTDLAESGIAGVTYVNRVGEMAGAAAAAAEAHAADASKSAYNAATAASNANTKAGDAAAAAAAAQASANAADDAAKSITNGDGITIEISDDKKKEITVKPKDNGGISVDEDGVAVKAGAGIVVDANGVAVKAGNGIDVDGGTVNVTPGVGIRINADAVDVNMGAGLKTDPNGAVTINEGVGLKLEGNVLVPNLIGGDSVTITPSTGDDKDKLVISANTPTANTPGVVEMPTYTEYQQILNPGVTPEPGYFGEGQLDRKYGLSLETYMNLAVQQQLDLQATFTTLLDKEVSLPTDTNNVGTNARPVYVNNGTAAAVESVSIPVDADNFENATTTAKIWIQ